MPTVRPRTERAAVAPRATITFGRSDRTSASSHGWQAVTSPVPGFWWIRRAPRWVNLKCLTAFVAYNAVRSIPASSTHDHSTAPAGPTNGLAAAILDVPRLLADQHEPGRRRSLPEDRARGVAEELAALASRGGLGEHGQRGGVGDERRGGPGGGHGRSLPRTRRGPIRVGETGHHGPWSTQPLSPIPGHERPVGMSDLTVDALGKLSEALEVVEHARGLLYGFHRLSGTADLALGEAIELFREAGHDEIADDLATDLQGRNVLAGRWTFQVVEEYDDGYYATFQDHERTVRDDLAGGTPPRLRGRDEGAGDQPGTFRPRACSGAERVTAPSSPAVGPAGHRSSPDAAA